MAEEYTCPECGAEFVFDASSSEEYVVCANCGERMRSPCAPSLRPGSIVGDYVIKKRIGIGGMGEVYLAEQRSMMRPVALKVLSAELYNDKTYLERFYREVRTLAQIEHPNIVKAIETGCDNDICYFSMMFIDGKDMKERLDESGRIPELDALHVVLNVAEALKFVWERHKIIHRDIKPANIMLTEEGEVKLMDLGISKVVEQEEKSPGLTLAGMMVGSPYYVSPEQAKAKQDIDFRADMYSLGATFHHMLTGKVPFDDESTMAIIAAHLSEPPPDPRKSAPEISAKSAEIVLKTMQKRKEDRYPTWDALLADIESAISSLTGLGRTTTMLSVPKKFKKRSTSKISGGKSGGTKTTSHSTATRNAPPNALRRFQGFLIRHCFGNLYVRFVFLATLLFFVLLAFANLVRQSVMESRQRALAARYSAVSKRMEQIKQTRKWTSRDLRILRHALIDLKRKGGPEYAVLAEQKLGELKRFVLEMKKEKRKRLIQSTLENLIRESTRLEDEKLYKDAIKLWTDYEKNGDFAIDLRDVIKARIELLETKMSEAAPRSGGIR